MDGYVLLRKDRPDALYVKEHLHYIEYCPGVDEEQNESLWVRI